MYNCVVLLLLLSPSLCDNQTLSPQHYAGTIADLHEWFHAGCTIIVSPDDPGLQLSHFISRVSQRLFDVGVSTAQFTFQTLSNVFDRMYCQHNPPLIVIIAGPQETLQLIRQLKEIPSYPRWLIFVDSTLPPIGELLENVNIPYDCEFIIANVDESQANEVVVTEVYRIHRDLPLNIEVFGNWSEAHGLRHNGLTLYERRHNLQGYIMRTATLNSPPIIIFQPKKNQSADKQLGVSATVQGYFGDVWTVLEERMNFTSSYYLPPDKAYGSQLPNGSWNGMIAMIMRDEVDIAINEFSMTLGRASAIDTLLPLIFTRSSVFIRQPQPVSLRWNNFLEPFEKSLWFAVIESIVVLGAILSFAYHTGRYFGNADCDGPPRYSFGYSLFSIFGCFCQQGDCVTPRGISSRTVHLLAGIMSIIVLAAYSGGLVSSLTIQGTELPFNSFSGMLKDGSYRLTVLAKSGKLNLLEQTEDALLKKLYTKLLLPYKETLPTSVIEGLRDVCKKNKYSFMTAYDIALGMLEGLLPCRLVALPNAALPDAAGMVLPKGSPYRGLFNFNLQYLRNAGVLNRLRVNAWSTSMPEAGSIFISVSLEAVTPIFSIMVAGITIGSLLLFTEMLGRYWWNRLKTRLRINRGLRIRMKRRTRLHWVRLVQHK